MLAQANPTIFASGPCEIDLARRELRMGGAPTPVGSRAFEIVVLLVQAAGELVTKDELMSRIWPGAIVLENTIQVHTLPQVRRALGANKTLLKTEVRTRLSPARRLDHAKRLAPGRLRQPSSLLTTSLRAAWTTCP